MLNFKSFRSAGAVLAGVKLMHMIRKRQFAIDATDAMSFAEPFFGRAGKVRSVYRALCCVCMPVGWPVRKIARA